MDMDGNSPESQAKPVSQSSLSEQLEADLAAIATSIRSTAQRYEGDMLSLLALLRVLEMTHRDVRENLFQDSQPDNRQRLYNLLKDIETEGGWPYIPRMRLKSILSSLIDATAPAQTDDRTDQ